MADGDAEAVRQLLDGGLTVPEIRLSRRQRRQRFLPLLTVVGAGLGVFAFFAGWLIEGASLGLIGGLVMCGTAMVVGVFGEIASYIGAKQLHVMSSTGTLVEGDRQLSFDDLMLPRRVDRLERIVQTEPDGPTEAPSPFVVIAHRTEDEIALRGGQHDFEEQDALADHINAIIAEYHLRKAAREWLALHDAGGSTPYRRTEP